MKKLAFLTLCLFALLPASAQTSYPSTVLADNPSAYWRMGEPAGSPGSADVSGHHEAAIAHAGVDFGSAGVLLNNSAVYLGGTGYFATPLLQNDVSQYSLEAWVNTFAAAAPILQDRGYTDETNHGALSITMGVGQPGMYDGKIHCGLDGDDVYLGAITQRLVNDGSWHHVVCVFSGVGAQVVTPQQFAVYVDGQPQTVQYNTIGPAPAPAAPVTGSGGTTIGIHPIWRKADSLPKYIGFLDEVAVYNYALTPTQVLSHYNAATCPLGCQ